MSKQPSPELTQQCREQDVHLLSFFSWQHLPERLQKVSQPFGALADQLFYLLPAGIERTAALRKLLEAKDCAVRASL